MPFAFLPDVESLINVVDNYGDDSIRIIYDVANAHFIGEPPAQGLNLVRFVLLPGQRLTLLASSLSSRVFQNDRCDNPLAAAEHGR
jgi:hypothetical protein